MKIILGSSSPRRKEILGALTGDFTVIPPKINENRLTGEAPSEYAGRISREKAQAVLSSLHDKDVPLLIITADTIVTIDDTILGKPVGLDDAVRMISLLQGKTHRVITSLTLLYMTKGADTPGIPEMMILTGEDISAVTFKSMSGENIADYLSLINYSDKAGSYACQEYGELIIDRIHGSVSNVIGFPLRLFFRMLISMKIIDEIW